MLTKTEISGIYRTNTGFQIRVSKRDPFSGKQVERTKALTGTFDLQEAIKEKEVLAKSLKEELSEGENNFRDMSKASFEAYSKFYQKYRLDNGIAKKNVVALDQGVFDKFILPHIGKIKLSYLNKRGVHHLVECLRNQMNDFGCPYSRETYLRAYRVFRAAIRMAYKLGFITEDPTSLVSPKFPYAKAVREKKSLSKEDAAKLLKAAEEQGEKIYFMICILTILGLRLSELKALTWADLNFEENYISISKSHHKGVLNTSTKNGSAFNAPMIGLVRSAAERYSTKYARNNKPSDLLFPSERSRSYMDNSYLRKVVLRLCVLAGIERVSPHDLRRSANTILLLSSVSPEICRKILNHKSVEMTSAYTQISTKQAGEVLDAVWSEIRD